VSSFEERVALGLRIRIDRALCVGFADCVKAAPEGFKLDEDSVAVFVRPEAVEREQLLRACDACPVDAITVWDTDGRQLVPQKVLP
jgi:ferredoxin